MHNASFSDLNQSWSHLAASLAAAPGLSQMQTHLEELQQALAEAREAEQRQLAHRAAVQQATRDFEEAKLRAHEAAVRLRSGLWNHLRADRQRADRLRIAALPHRQVPETRRGAVPPRLRRLAQRWGMIPQRSRACPRRG